MEFCECLLVGCSAIIKKIEFGAVLDLAQIPIEENSISNFELFLFFK
jgi:hypothetical protein